MRSSSITHLCRSRVVAAMILVVKTVSRPCTDVSRDEMGLVRVALALAVVLSHLPPATFHFISGGLAVQGFFIISGFYMALVLSGKYASAGIFYSNRLLRLMPGYFVMMVIAGFLLLVLNA